MSHGARLKRLIESRGFTVTEAARIARMPKQQAQRIVSGGNPNPGILTVERLVAAVGATMAELFAAEDEPS